MKIGIITFWWSKNNYGQLLQCYALQSFLKKCGHKPFLIRFGGNVSVKPNNNFLKKIILRLFKCLNPVAVYCYIHNRQNRKFQKKEKEKAVLFESNDKRNFDLFRREELTVSPIHYKNYFELNKFAPVADTYIVGSDVVWSTEKDIFGEWHKAMFLGFGSDSVRRVSYAPSFGAGTYGKKYIDEISPYLKKFYAVSVREKSGIEICSRAGRNDAVHVVDPTCLLRKNDYLKICENITPAEKDFIFLYCLNFDTPQEVAWKELNDFCLENDACDLKVCLSDGMNLAYDRLPGANYVFDSIQEWLAHYRDAKYIVTNSFHGLVFAIVMNKPFLLIPLKGRYAVLNSRPFSLLESLGLNDRILDSNKNFNQKIVASIDWTSVNKKLEELRIYSVNFLKNALSKN